jgi:HAD superfamily hydrolase (TIGR01484 family)
MSSQLPKKEISLTTSPAKPRPEPWAMAQPLVLQRLRGVCLDIDDTLTTEGKLTSQAFDALWKLKRAGFTVVPITGRPAGWCDHIARSWPVHAVVGENGAFTFFMEKGVRKSMITEAQQDNQIKIVELGKRIRTKFPNATWASDQKYREYDLAIDICEDVARWEPQDVKSLIEICQSAGAHAKLSSIHVNAWFGNYNKRKGFEHWLKNGAPGCDSNSLPDSDQWIYIGDSPNDESMFESFKYSVGVANLETYLDELTFPPTWLTKAESGRGFVEMVEKLIESRN